ncbi:ABC transporter ATP-binding protein [Crocinitomicaceae bacterium]|nr:ABC transporter ATP-binding protein [Crocinitomicaceae bacterium]
MSTVLKVENLDKIYRLGEVGTGTLSHDLNRWWHLVRGKEDPYAKVGQVNNRESKSQSDYVYALKDINFDVQQGEVLGVIGRNGAGKSTLLKIISQITSPSRGSIKAKGRIASLLEVGTGMNPELTARENIYLNGAILGMTKAEIRSKFDEIIDFSGCNLFVDTPIKRFSSGMRVRLGFAVAAFLEPEILIIDEVLAVGDAEFQNKAIGKMKDVSKNGGRTVLFVSHNMGAVKSLCPNSILLKNGELINSGKSDDIVGEYLKDQNQISELNSSERLEEIKNKPTYIDSIQFKNQNKEAVNEVISGHALNIEISVKSNRTISKGLLNILFLNKEGLPVSMIRSDEIGVKHTFDGRNSITIHIPKMNLRPEKYFINVVVADKNFEALNILDNIGYAASIEVLSSDFYDSGKLIKKGGFGIMNVKILK